MFDLRISSDRLSTIDKYYKILYLSRILWRKSIYLSFARSIILPVVRTANVTATPQPQLMVKKFPLDPSERTTWATTALPNKMRTKVPKNSARNSRTIPFVTLTLWMPDAIVFLLVILLTQIGSHKRRQTTCLTPPLSTALRWRIGNSAKHAHTHAQWIM